MTDASLFLVGFGSGFVLRLGATEFQEKFLGALPGILVAALVFVCAAYITGLYEWPFQHSWSRRIAALGISLGVTSVAMVLLFYAVGSPGVGRGVLLLGASSTFLSCLVHHLRLLRRNARHRERVALISAGPDDERRVSTLTRHWGGHFDVVGWIHSDSVPQGQGLRVLGPMSRMVEVAERERIQRILCTDDVLRDPAWCQPLSAAMFSGVAITPLLSVCEEIHQCVPLELLTPDWLLSASSQPHRFYLLKAKRVFDIVIALALLLSCAPLILAAIAAIRLTSPGPVFYSQVRCGRLGRRIRITKLRTMRVDAEKSGPAWSGRGDSRVTPVGALLRKYRIDELLQLVSVLKGDMSFVGPRPERPEFMAMLEREIPRFGDRLLVQPGLTGWAQVNHPYGATVDDARRKLEYDLYYMKHMGLYLDVLILLDTIRTVVLGGVTRVRPRVEVGSPSHPGGGAGLGNGLGGLLGHS